MEPAISENRLKTVVLFLTVTALAVGGILACLILYSLFRAASDRANPTPPVAPEPARVSGPGEPDEACLLRRLDLVRDEGCQNVCPVVCCKGKSRVARRLCRWLDALRGA